MPHVEKPAALTRSRPSGIVDAWQLEDTVSAPTPQQIARVYEDAARQSARLALALHGALSFQQVALSRHYSQRAVALMSGGSR